jgi:hypothetical protein
MIELRECSTEVNQSQEQYLHQHYIFNRVYLLLAVIGGSTLGEIGWEIPGVLLE